MNKCKSFYTALQRHDFINILLINVQGSAVMTKWVYLFIMHAPIFLQNAYC